jgi:nucleotide-binding universal stress UspA family protein
MMFQRVLVGFDGSAAAERALALAKQMRAADGEIVSLTVAETHYAMHAGMYAVEWDETLRADAEKARSAGEAQLNGVPTAAARVVTGHAAHALLAAADSMNADVVAVGSHGKSRIRDLLVGSVVTRVVRTAHCSVLVAHGADPIRVFPQSIAVGVDGSSGPTGAEAVAEALAAAGGADLRRVEGKRQPAEALVEASKSADLVVVGSRESHGLPALASVAERVAHRSACPVLIVR